MTKCHFRGFPIGPILAMVILLSLCSSSPSAVAQVSSTDTAGCDQIVGIGSGGMSFENRTVRIEPSQTVCWIWTNETAPHNIAQTEDNSDTTRMEGGVYSGAPNITVDFRHTFTENQTFYYICEPHAAVMKGVVIVGGKDNSTKSNSTPHLSASFTILVLVGVSALDIFKTRRKQ